MYVSYTWEGQRESEIFVTSEIWLLWRRGGLQWRAYPLGHNRPRCVPLISLRKILKVTGLVIKLRFIH